MPFSVLQESWPGGVQPDLALHCTSPVGLQAVAAHGFSVGLILDSAVMDRRRFYGTGVILRSPVGVWFDLAKAGQPAAQVAAELGISD